MTGRVGLGLGLHAENVFLSLARSRLACGMLVRLVIAAFVMKDMFKRRRFWRYRIGAGGRGISRSLQVIGNRMPGRAALEKEAVAAMTRHGRVDIVLLADIGDHRAEHQ